MNIFYLDHDPVIAATLAYDSHVVKMPLESMQMLCTNIQIIFPEYTNPALMKRCFENHPCTVWARSSKDNFRWLVKHTGALFAEYTKRYKKVHACQAKFEELDMVFLHCEIELQKRGSVALTPPAQAMPDEFKSIYPVIAYHRYYEHKKQLEQVKVNMYDLAKSLGMKEYADGKKVRKIALKMVHLKSRG
jgi:hypothetical protein